LRFSIINLTIAQFNTANHFHKLPKNASISLQTSDNSFLSLYMHLGSQLVNALRYYLWRVYKFI